MVMSQADYKLQLSVAHDKLAAVAARANVTAQTACTAHGRVQSLVTTLGEAAASDSASQPDRLVAAARCAGETLRVVQQLLWDAEGTAEVAAAPFSYVSSPAHGPRLPDVKELHNGRLMLPGDTGHPQDGHAQFDANDATMSNSSVSGTHEDLLTTIDR
jgi:hypothetical protein